MTPHNPHSKMDKFKLIAGLKFKSSQKGRMSSRNRVFKRTKLRRNKGLDKSAIKFYNDFDLIKQACWVSNSQPIILNIIEVKNGLANILKSKKIGISGKKFDLDFNKTEEIYLSARINIKSDSGKRNKNKHLKTLNQHSGLKKYIDSRKSFRDEFLTLETSTKQPLLKCSEKVGSRLNHLGNCTNNLEN